MTPFKLTRSTPRRTSSIRLTASLLAAAAGTALLSAAPLGAMAAPEPYATATSADSLPAVAVQYGDLNLGTERGARILFARIRMAADEVCPAAADIRDLNRVTAHNRCMRQAIERAVQEVGSPRLAAVSSGQSRHG